MSPEPDRVYFSEVGEPETWDDLPFVVYPSRMARKLRRLVRLSDGQRHLEEMGVRLDAELWRPPLQWHPPVDHETQDARLEWRRRQRPFRRAFPGGEQRRRILLAVGVSNAKRAES